MSDTAENPAVIVEDLGKAWFVAGTSNPKLAREEVKKLISSVAEDEPALEAVDRAEPIVKTDWFWKPTRGNMEELACAAEDETENKATFVGVLLK